MNGFSPQPYPAMLLLSPRHHSTRTFLRFLLVCAFVFSTGIVRLQSAETLARNSTEVSAAIAAARPGDQIVLADGTWTDQRIVFNAQGTAAQPITLRAQTPGKVIFNGSSGLQIGGRHLVIDGFYFKGDQNAPAKAVVDFRAESGEVAAHCRLTRCAIVDYSAADKNISTNYVRLYGEHNRVDHCYFRGKTNASATLVVNFQAGAAPNYHRIDHSYFAHRPFLGFNGGESIQVGWSGAQNVNSRTTVEFNYFEECNGEGEIITSKSCENVYRYNTFVRSEGVLCLRVGHRCVVEGNYFLGENTPGTGGIHIFGEDHKIINNYLAGLEGSGPRAALSFMNGTHLVSVGSEILPADPRGVPLHSQVRRVLVAFNTFVDCASLVETGLFYERFRKESVLFPADCVIANNLFQARGALAIVKTISAPRNFTWQGNLAAGEDVGPVRNQGITAAGFKLSRDSAGFWRPDRKGVAAGGATGSFPSVTDDIDGQPRPEAGKDVGCDQISDAAITRRPLRPRDVGPSWMNAGDS